MKTEVKIHITEDDLSESIKSKIKQLRKQGVDVEIIWPKNYDQNEYNKWLYITPDPAPINPIPAYLQDPVWLTTTPAMPSPGYDIYCTATCTLN